MEPSTVGRISPASIPKSDGQKDGVFLVSEKERIIRRVLLNPGAAVEALAVRELALHQKILNWCIGDDSLLPLELAERASVAILEAGPTHLRWEFVMHPERQQAIIRGVQSVGGLWGYRDSQLVWVDL